MAFEDLRLSIAGGGDAIEKDVGLDGVLEHAADTGRLSGMVSERLQGLEAQSSGELCGVAHFGVAIEGQMIGQQGNIGFEEESDPLPERTDEAGRFRAVPQNTVVNQDRIGIVVRRPGEKSSGGGDGRDDAPYLGLPFNLKSVGTVVTNAVNFEQRVQFGNQ